MSAKNIAAPRPCTYPGCGKLVRWSSRCDAHAFRSGLKFGDARRGNRHERGYGTAWDKLRKQVLERDAGICKACEANGRATPAAMVDHIINKARGGTDELSNLRAICRACHRSKTAHEGKEGGA